MALIDELLEAGVVAPTTAKTSKEIDKLAAALSKAQGEFSNPPRELKNAFKGYMYATLSGFLNACRPILSRHGLSITQVPMSSDGVTINTESRLMHSSGQFIAGSLALSLSKLDPQSAGSVIAYIRKYSLQSLLGLAQEDDDGQKGMPNSPRPDAGGGTATMTSTAATTAGTTVRMNPQTTIAMSDQHQAQKILQLAEGLGWSPDKLREILGKVGAKKIGDLTYSDADLLISKMEYRDAKEEAKQTF